MELEAEVEVVEGDVVELVVWALGGSREVGGTRNGNRRNREIMTNRRNMKNRDTRKNRETFTDGELQKNRKINPHGENVTNRKYRKNMTKRYKMNREEINIICL